MKIYAGTGVTTTGDLYLTKGISNVLFLSTKAFSELTTETITILVQKANGGEEIAIDMLLKDFLVLGTFGEDAIHNLDPVKIHAMCELTEDGGYIPLQENETIKFKLADLDATKTYELHGIESPFPSKELRIYERRTMAADQLTQDFDVIGCDVLSLHNHASISEIELTYDNGSTTKHTTQELQAIQLQVDPIAIVGSGVIEPIYTGRIVTPLKGVTNVRIRKSAGTMLNFCVRIDQSDYIQYQLPNRRK